MIKRYEKILVCSCSLSISSSPVGLLVHSIVIPAIHHGNPGARAGILILIGGNNWSTTYCPTGSVSWSDRNRRSIPRLPCFQLIDLDEAMTE